jgi:hypothetical protein
VIVLDVVATEKIGALTFRNQLDKNPHDRRTLSPLKSLDQELLI